jgi:hypothetical protein
MRYEYREGLPSELNSCGRGRIRDNNIDSEIRKRSTIPLSRIDYKIPYDVFQPTFLQRFILKIQNF